MSGSLRITWFATTLLTLVVASAGAQNRIWRPDERTIISDGGMLGAVAPGIREVYAASPANILVYDAPFQRWTTPIPLPPEIGDARVTALAWDAALATLWLGTDRGDLWLITPGPNVWDRVSAFTRGAIEFVIADRRQAAVWIRAGGEWLRAASGFPAADPVPSSSVPREVLQQTTQLPDDPFLRSARGTLGLDPAGRRWSLVDVERGANPGEYWIATRGGGLLHFDSRFDRRDWLRYGLASRGAASIARIDDWLWFGGDGRGERSGVARAGADLETWTQFDGDEGAPRGFVAEIVRFGDAYWFGSSDGLFTLDAARIDDARRRAAWTRRTTRDGLASDAVRSLVVAGGRLWAGTDRGLSSFDAQGRPVDGPLLGGRRVSRMVVRGDSLYIANDDGVSRIALSDANAQPQPWSGNPALRGRVTDLALLDGAIFAIAGGAVYAADASSPPLRDPMLTRIGDAYRLAAGDGRLWVAGPGGIAYRDPSSGAWTAFTAPGDVRAGPVVDVLPVGDDVWAATPAGAIRLRWR